VHRSFLTIQDDKVGLIHQSAKDYLLRKNPDSNPELELFRVKEAAANLAIVRKCMNYMESGSLKGGVVDLKRYSSHLESFPLLEYAVLHWPEHARSLDRSDEIFDLSLPFHQRIPGFVSLR